MAQLIRRKPLWLREVSVLNLTAGDVLVLQTEDDLDRDEVAEIKAQTEAIFGPDVKAIVLTGGLSVHRVIHRGV